MRSPSIRRFSGWIACCLCLIIPVLVGCGDYCLFCDGQGGGGGGGQKRTAEAGDVILADQLASSISIYEYPDATQRSLLAGYDDVSGLALYSSGAVNECDNPFSGLQDYQSALNVEIVETFTEQRDGNDRLSIAVIPKGMTFPYGADQMQVDQTTNDLLFFTVNTQNKNALYIYDLTGTSIPPIIDNPIPITNAILGTGFFDSPTALAISVAGNTVTVFFINDKEGDSSVRRLSVNLSSWVPGSPRTIATMTESGRRLIDIAYYDQTDELFVSKRTTADTGGNGGWVHVVSDAKDRTSPVNLDSDTAFIVQPYELTGVKAAPTNRQESQASLLCLRANQLGQAEQYDIELGGAPEAVFNFSTSFQFPQALAYDCTNERLLMTDVPLNEDSYRTFFQAFPSQ